MPKFKEPNLERIKLRNYYENKFYNIFLSNFEYDAISYQEYDFIMRKFWGDGTIAGYKLPVVERLIFAPYNVEGLYNIYDYPINVRLVNSRGVRFIPNKRLSVDKDVVIGWIQRNHKGVRSSIISKIDLLVDIEMTIRSNLKAQKMPWLIAVTPENEFKMRSLFDKINNDETQLYVSIDDAKNFTNLVTGAPYIIDKLYQYKTSIESEILTILGIDNLGVMEKKEHLMVDEVNSNNDLIEDNANQFSEMLLEFTSNIRDVLGVNISIRPKRPKLEETTENQEEDQDNDNM